MDEGNSVAENGILGSVGYVERNNLGKVQGKHLLSLENSLEPYQTFERRNMKFLKENTFRMLVFKFVEP